MSPSLHLKYLLLNIHLYALFHLINPKRTGLFGLSISGKFEPKKGVFGSLTPIVPIVSISSNLTKSNKNLSQKAKQSQTKVKQSNDSYSEPLSHPNCGLNIYSYIVGGTTAKQFYYPWIGALNINGEFRGSVNIINKWWVLTVAHALQNLKPNDVISIKVGNINRTGGINYNISKIIPQKYNTNGNNEQDIALIRIKGPFRLNRSIQPICLPEEDDPPPKEGEVLNVAGWGYPTYAVKINTNILREVRLTVMSNDKCAKIYSTLGIEINHAQICTHNVGKDTCVGDSGGPAIKVINGLKTLVGLISFGRTCADEFPGVYTKVSDYIKWIKNVFKANKF